MNVIDASVVEEVCYKLLCRASIELPPEVEKALHEHIKGSQIRRQTVFSGYVGEYSDCPRSKGASLPGHRHSHVLY